MRDVAMALHFLVMHGASPRLVRHHELVAETAGELLAALRELGLVASIDVELVLVGAAIHDVGKLEHARELDEPGSAHERAGFELLQRAGHPELARFAVWRATTRGSRTCSSRWPTSCGRASAWPSSSVA